MLTTNLWTERGLVNGAMGTVKCICYQNGNKPPSLPTAVTVLFDKYCGPTLFDGSVPIVPIRKNWSSSTGSCSCLQLPLKLSWAFTISQGLALDKAVIDIWSREFCTDLT